MLRPLLWGLCIGNQCCSLRLCSVEMETKAPGSWQLLRTNNNQQSRLPDPFLKILFNKGERHEGKVPGGRDAIKGEVVIERKSWRY